jgi:VWA domain-containing protein/aerotolerance regulator-like protein
MTFRGLPITSFWTLFGALALGLLLIYLLRLRRRGRVISSTLIWQRVAKTRRSIWNEVLAFLLHLLMLGLIAFALTDPLPTNEEVPRRFLGIIIDSSISMTAPVGPDEIRMDKAADSAWDLVTTMAPNDRAIVVSAGPQVRALTTFTTNADRVKDALESIQPQGRAPRIADAIDYVRQAYAFSDPKSTDQLQIYLFSDRPDDATSAPDVKTIGVGDPLPNTGIVAFDVRKPFNKTGGHELLVRVGNFGTANSRSRLVVYTPEATIGKTALTIKPGESQTHHYYLPFGVQGKVTALLQDVVSKEGPDGLIADDAAFAFIPPQKKTRVLLVSNGNVFLEKALALNPQVSLAKVSPEGYSHGASAGANVVILDDFTPPQPPAANAIYLHPSGGPFSLGEKVENPSITSWADEHPMFRYIQLNDLTIAEGQPIKTKKGDTILAGHFDDALILARAFGSRTYVAFGFSLKKSDLPLRVAFPILFHNAVTWFSETDDVEQRTGHRLGEPIRLPVTPGATKAVLLTPQKDEIELIPRAGQVSVTPNGPGFYLVNDGAKETTLAASLVDPEESDLSGARPERAKPLPRPVGAAKAEAFWPLLIALAFLLMVVDFLLYNYGKLP